MQKSAIFSIRVRKKKIQGQVTRALPRKEDRAWLAGIIEGEGSVLWASYGNDEWRAKISIIMNDGAVTAYAAKLMGATPFYDKKRKRWHTYAEGFRAIQVAKLYWSSYAWSEEGASVRHGQCRTRLQGTRAAVALQIGL